LYQLLEDERLNHRVVVHPQVRGDEGGSLLQDFFGQIRAQRKRNKKSQTL